MSKIVDVREAYRGYAKVSVLTLVEADGATHQREVVDFGRSACVLPYDPARKTALIVRVPRAPLLLEGVPETLIEAPAGMIDPGETPEQAAVREAFEEVGVVLSALELVGAVWPSPGVVAERSHLFLAPYGAENRQGRGGGLADEHEGVVAEEVTLAELWGLVERAELRDMKTLTVVLALRARHPDLF